MPPSLARGGGAVKRIEREPERLLLIVLLFMAQRRMFSSKIVDTDAFLDMGQGSQLLYFHLAMRADDDGFVSNPKKVMRMIGAQEDDYKVLLAKRFVIAFESGVCVIKHWLIHNLIRVDRYTETQWTKERQLLSVDPKTKKYSLNKGENDYVIPNDNQLAPQVRLGKDREVNTMPPGGDGIEKMLTEGRIQHDYQFIGLEVFEKVGAPANKKGECIRLAKLYPNFIQPSLSFCLDYPNQALKWKMFLWKLNSLVKESNEKKS